MSISDVPAPTISELVPAREMDLPVGTEMPPLAVKSPDADRVPEAATFVVLIPPLAVKRPVVVTELLNVAAPVTVRVPVERAAMVNEELVEMSPPVSCLIENGTENPESTNVAPFLV